MFWRRFIPVLFPVLLLPGIAAATQTHPEPEGLYAHQLAHLFFIFAMGTLAYWLKARGLTRSGGWRLIRFAAMLLILWNIDAFAAHFLDEMTDWVRVRNVSPYRLEIHAQPGFEFLSVVYYLVKLDHLFCVPALFCLYFGLRRLGREENPEGNQAP